MTLTMIMPTPPPVAPSGPRRMELHKKVHATSASAARVNLERLLRAQGWTRQQTDALAGISTDHLTALVTNLPPGFDTYLAWGTVGRTMRMPTKTFTALLLAAQQYDYTVDEVHALSTYGRGHDLTVSPNAWLIDHLSVGNRVQDVRPWGRRTPSWLVAWSRTRIPPTDVPEVQLSEGALWRYIDIVTRFPNLPEPVVAHTLMHSPNPITTVDEPGAWLLTCWNPTATAKAAA